ncbi:MAG: hypothetical protein LBV02_05465 [Bacteroidales bacterium]|jgi:hypothetical protein|nr:hypothetical protein [Bacteroidales bacterium]
MVEKQWLDEVDLFLGRLISQQAIRIASIALVFTFAKTAETADYPKGQPSNRKAGDEVS